MVKRLFFLFSILLLGLNACTTSTLNEEEVNTGLEYYPLEIGFANIYNVKEVRYTFVDGTITSNYQLKELVKDTFRLQDGTLAYTLERTKRTDTLSNIWVIDSVWYATLSPQQAVKYENSIPTVKLTFPVRNGRRWQTFAMNNTFPDQNDFSTIQRVGQTFAIDGKQFFNTVIVNQRADSSCRTQVQKREVYMPNVGLVYRKWLSFVYSETNPPCTPPLPIEIGRDYEEIFVRRIKE